uniref:C-type lectin domain-containing protein n=1 Tax=Poecilia latipinna TaxID=48699 RepID=A0A3B3VTG6_9TELE
MCSSFSDSCVHRSLVSSAAPAEDKLRPTAPRYNFCPEFWFMYEGRCYKYFSSPKSWYDAEEHCTGVGGHLASVLNPRQYSFLQQIIQTASQSRAWLGGFNLQNRWLWINQDGFYYTNWYQLSSVPSYPCIDWSHLISDGWGNTQCTVNIPFICFKNPFGC